MKVLHDRCSINCEGGLMSSFLMVGPAMASIKSVLTRPAGFEMTRLLAQSPGCNAPLVSSYLTNGFVWAKKMHSLWICDATTFCYQVVVLTWFPYVKSCHM